MAKTSTGSNSQQKIQDYLDSLGEGIKPDPKVLASLAKEPEEKIDIAALIEEAVAKRTAQLQQPNLNAADLLKAIKGDDKSNAHQAHGITQGQMKEIQKNQQLGKVEMLKGNKVSRYEFPDYEKDFIHFSVERVTFKPDTDIKTSRPKILVKTVTDFERMSKAVKGPGEKANPENAFGGMKMIILHDPRTGEDSPKSSKKMSEDEMFENATEDMIRALFLEVIGEEALPSDSKKIMIGMIKEKRAEA